MSTNNINLGKVLITPRGAWSSEINYKQLDLVYVLDGSYIARKSNKGTPVTDDSVWQLIAGRGPAGTGNVSVIENDLQTGKKYLFVPSANNSAEGYFEEYTPSSFIQQQSDWNQTQTDQPDFIKNKPSLFSGDYSDLQNSPFIPNKVSDLDNDTSFITQMEVEEGYQPKESGRGLSANDYTSAEKNKLEGIENEAQKNRPIIHKSVTLEPSNWELFEGKYRARVPIIGTDSNITVGSTIWGASDGSDGSINAEIITEAIMPNDGYFYIRANSFPTVNINILYSIGL